MTTFAATMARDGNRQIINSNEAFLLESTWTFVVNTTGDTTAHTLFTVTGNAIVTVFGVCDTNIAGAGTMEVGVAGNTAGIIAQIANAEDLDDGDIWVDATPAVGVEAIPTTKIINDGADIILTIGTTDLTAGVVDFYCLWRPLSSDADITVTTPAQQGCDILLVMDKAQSSDSQPKAEEPKLSAVELFNKLIADNNLVVNLQTLEVKTISDGSVIIGLPKLQISYKGEK